IKNTSHKLFEAEHMHQYELSAQISQLQALTAELKSGFMGAVEDLSRIQQGDRVLEEKVKSTQQFLEEKVADVKNSLSGFKRDLSNVLSQIQELSDKQREMQQNILQLEKQKDTNLIQNRRGQEEGLTSQISNCLSLNQEPNLMDHCFANLSHHSPFTQEQEKPSINFHITVQNLKGFFDGLHNADTEEGFKSAPSADAQHRSHLTSSTWRDNKEHSDTKLVKDNIDHFKGLERSRYNSMENGLDDSTLPTKRQNAVMELLESERVHVFYLSLILKISTMSWGPELMFNNKDRSNFHRYLQVLARKHLELVHMLQERVMKRQWQGLIGDIFTKVASNENDFLVYYAAYLKELPEYISLIQMMTVKGDTADDELRPDPYTLLFQTVQRIPEYILLLQNLLKYTEQNHPDYYLLQMSIQQFRAFISHYSLLFQYNENLLIQNKKDLKKSSLVNLYKTLASHSSQDVYSNQATTSNKDSAVYSEELQGIATPNSAVRQLVLQVRKNKQRLLDQIQPLTAQEWEPDGSKCDRQETGTNPSLFFSSDLEMRAKPSLVQSVSEREYENISNCMMEHLTGRRMMKNPTDFLASCRNLIPEYEDLIYRRLMGQGGPLGEEEPLQNISVFENCSAASSDSSLDICFLRANNYLVDHDAAGHPVQLLPRNGAGLENAGLFKQPLHRQNKAANGSTMDLPCNVNVAETYKIPLRPTLSKGGSPHLKVDKNVQLQINPSTPKGSQRNIISLQKTDMENNSPVEARKRMEIEKTVGFLPKQKEDASQTSPSEPAKKQDQKGTFKNSFRKLFKKK
uniref:Rho guanine nucleotide exchange factor 33 n=1 Tax=Latimeria chalumnae TaxID=7897 RepID=H2ZV73_LATCH